LPSREEWDDLGQAAGGERKLDDDDGAIDWYGAGKKLKTTSGWDDYQGKSGNGTDNYGFSALPGGIRYSDGDFYYAGGYGGWWTATEYGAGDAYYRGMGYDIDHVGEYGSNKSDGFSVRCLSD
jgi:uncharacterized protein (TIGR02145 family)